MTRMAITQAKTGRLMKKRGMENLLVKIISPAFKSKYDIKAPRIEATKAYR